MAHIGLDEIGREAQDLTDECGRDIEACVRDDDGEHATHVGIMAKPFR